MRETRIRKFRQHPAIRPGKPATLRFVTRYTTGDDMPRLPDGVQPIPALPPVEYFRGDVRDLAAGEPPTPAAPVARRNPAVSRVVLRIELADGSFRMTECEKPSDVEFEVDTRRREWLPWEYAEQAGVLDSPPRISIRFTAGRKPMRVTTNPTPDIAAILAAYVRATGWSYQEALDRATAMGR